MRKNKYNRVILRRSFRSLFSVLLEHFPRSFTLKLRTALNEFGIQKQISEMVKGNAFAYSLDSTPVKLIALESY